MPAKSLDSILVFANGSIDDGPMVQRALAAVHSPYVIAVDGGAHIARHFNLEIDLIIGDMDSVSPELLDELVDSSSEIIRHPPEKDFTDLELALLEAHKRGASQISIIGGLGGRFDQTLANVYLLARPEFEQIDIRLMAGKQEIRLMQPGTCNLRGEPGDTVSLIPVGGAATGITTTNLRYPLAGETLEFGPARGVSNVMDDSQALIKLEAGMLLVIHTIGRA